MELLKMNHEPWISLYWTNFVIFNEICKKKIPKSNVFLEKNANIFVMKLKTECKEIFFIVLTGIYHFEHLGRTKLLWNLKYDKVVATKLNELKFSEPRRMYLHDCRKKTFQISEKWSKCLIMQLMCFPKMRRQHIKEKTI